MSDDEGLVNLGSVSEEPEGLLSYIIDFKLAIVTFRILQSSQPAYLCHSTHSLRLSNTNLFSSLSAHHLALAASVWQPLKFGTLFLRLSISVLVLIPSIFTSRTTVDSRPSSPFLLCLRFSFC